jgi:chromatin remodeling complex protein RSC6
MPKGGLMKKLVTLTPEMFPVFGKGKSIKVGDLTKKVWAYIKANELRHGSGPLMKQLITITADMSPVWGVKEGKSIKVAELMKGLWAYIKEHDLLAK